MQKDSYIDFLVLFVCGVGFAFAVGVGITEDRLNKPSCDGTPFNVLKRADGSVSCYYKLDPSSYKTTTVTLKGNRNGR